MAILIKNGRVIDPASNTDWEMNILIEDNKIVDIFNTKHDTVVNFKNGSYYDKIDVIDAKGKIVVPGLIDCHVHFREPGFEQKETILTGSKAAAKGGFCAVICEPNTLPPVDSIEMVERIMEIARTNAIVKLFTKACITKGSLGMEVTDIHSFVKEKGVLAISDDGNPVVDDDVVNKAFSIAKKVDMPVSPHCEDSHLSISQKQNTARFSNPPYKNESNYIARDIEVAEKIGTRLHISHVSLKESVKNIREAKRRGLAEITCEAAPHHLILDKEFVDVNGIKPVVNPPLRSKEDVEAVREGLADGTIDVIASDHAPHTLEDKKRGAMGIIGLETSLGLILSEIVNKGILSLADAIRKMSYNPALIFGINGGRLSIGIPADITIIDPDNKWIVNTSQFESKSKNCPFQGFSLVGKADSTIINGKFVMKDGKLC